MMSLTKVACNQLSKRGLWLGVVSSIFAISPAFAAPDPVFDPVLDELATSTAPIRLPSLVSTDVELHPVARELYPGAHILAMRTQPECRAERCLGLQIVTVAEPGPWPATENLRQTPLTEVVLGDSTQGYSSEAGGFGSVEWIQDGALYIMIYSEDIFSKENAISMANSMISESPVSRGQ